MEDFKLNLQLFAEGEVAGEVVQPDSQDTANGSQEPSEGNIDFEFAIDQDGNVVFVDDDEQQEGTPDQQQQAQQQQQEKAMAMAQVGADVAQKAGNLPMDQDTALTRFLGVNN